MTVHAELAVPVSNSVPLPVNRAWLCAAKRADPVLEELFAKVVSNSNETDERIAYYLADDLLMGKWSPSVPNDEWKTVFKIVVPAMH